MIYTCAKVTIDSYSAFIDRPIILYRGDRNVEIQIEIIEGDYRQYKLEGSNTILNLNASYGQLVIQKPDYTSMVGDIVPTDNGTVIFVIPQDMIDETTEVGYYTFQIRLYDETQTSRVTLPPVEKGIILAEPIESADLI